ncbi:MAG: hypothetical protein AABZ53_10760 [Planctomycetota bacterium]
MRLALTIASAAGLPAAAQSSTYTGGSAIDQTNWCDGDNWFPSGVPADGSTINVPAGKTPSMFQCSSVMRILGPIIAAGSIRFWTPVTFAGGGSLTDPIFDLSTTPAPVGGAIQIGGLNSAWHGAIFSGGDIANSGTLTIQRTSFGSRQFPRALTNGCLLTNTGTVRVLDGFDIDSGSLLLNQGNLNCETTSTISCTVAPSTLENIGSLSVVAGQALTVSTGFTSSGLINCPGNLTFQRETSLTGLVNVDPLGTVRIQAPANSPISLGPVNLVGNGTVQLSSGQIHLLNVSVAASGNNGAFGLRLACSTPLDLSEAFVSVTGGGLVTWSLGELRGDNGARQDPHFNIASGGIFSAVGGPGFAGGGNSYGTFFQIAGSMYQYATVRFFDASRAVILPGGHYRLSHARLDGDDSGLLDVRGTLDVNPPGDPRTDAAYLNYVPLKLSGSAEMIVHANDLNTTGSGALARVELSGTPTIQIGTDDGSLSDARWKAFGETVVIDGDSLITGNGEFELASGSTLTVRSASIDFDLHQQGTFKQLGTLRADPGAAGAGARVKNHGTWNWLGGGITFPQGSENTIVNHGVLYADCGSCQLRADLLNKYGAHVVVIDTLVLAEQGVVFTNQGDTELRGHISDAGSALECRIVNPFNASIRRMGVGTTSTINTTLDNEGLVLVTSGTLAINGPIVQFVDGDLRDGTWHIPPGSTLATPGKVVTLVGVNAQVDLGGTWPQFQPVANHGTLFMRGGTHLLPPNFFNYGTLGGACGISVPVLRNQGTVSPGNSPGTLSVQGAFDQSAPSGILDIELAGLTPGTQHDVLAISGAAALGGTLRVRLLDGFLPTSGDSFTILTAASITGAFSTVEPPTLPNPGLQMHTLIGPTSIVLSFVCPADFDADTVVDFFDYDAFVQCFEGTTCPIGRTADFDADGSVDFFDYDAFVVAFELGC